VAYDHKLADRIRALLADEPDVTEKKMFGGLAFLIAGNIAVAASGQGGLLVRVEPARAGELIATTRAQPMEMRGRPMQGWLCVADADVRTNRQLARWIALGTDAANNAPHRRTTRRPPPVERPSGRT
jgi:TfoX/Sxy family transcriptional regulator of competence genes